MLVFGVYDMTTHREVALLTGNMGPVSGVAFSPDGSIIVSGNEDGTAWVWNRHTGKHIQTFEISVSILSVAISPDGKTIATGSGEESEMGSIGITLLDITTGEYLKSFGGPYEVLSVCFSPDGKNDRQ